MCITEKLCICIPQRTSANKVCKKKRKVTSTSWYRNAVFPHVVFLTLNLQVEDDLVWPKAVTGHTSVVPRILCFHCANNKAPITVDAAPAVNHNRCWGPIAETQICLQLALRFQCHTVTLKREIQLLLRPCTHVLYLVHRLYVCICSVLTSPSATWWLGMDHPLLYRAAQYPSSRGSLLSYWRSGFEPELQIYTRASSAHRGDAVANRCVF